MAYSKPNSFTNGQPLTGTALKGNDDALKVYLHEGVIAGDLKATPWIETRHIQPPILEPITGIQHGVTGVQGSQWTGGVAVKAQFATAFLTAARSGTTNQDSWEIVPQTTMQFTLRRNALVMFHWWMESNNGPDNSAASPGADGYLWVSEYSSGGLASGTGKKSIVQSSATECVQNHQGWISNPPGGPLYPYTLLGYGNMAGTQIFPRSSDVCVGLAHLSLIDRSAIINWGVHIEAYYL
jgi:hypothetical protein